MPRSRQRGPSDRRSGTGTSIGSLAIPGRGARSPSSNSGVDPATRGRRLDECLAVLRALAGGETIDHRGEFFTLEGASIRPAPDPPVPVIVGGKGDAAVRRAARHGDGWLAIFCSPRRFGQTRQQIADAAAALGRTPPSWYGVNVWCGLDTDARQARLLLGRQMETLYHLPFERFERVALAGTPTQVAEQLAPFVAAGAANLTVVPAAASAEAGVEHVAAVRHALRRESAGVGPVSGILG